MTNTPYNTVPLLPVTNMIIYAYILRGVRTKAIYCMALWSVKGGVHPFSSRSTIYLQRCTKYIIYTEPILHSVEKLPFKPSWCIKASFCMSEWWLHFLHLRGFEQTFSWDSFIIINNIPFLFATHFKLSSFTTSRELREQFTTCSWRRWQKRWQQ